MDKTRQFPRGAMLAVGFFLLLMTGRAYYFSIYQLHFVTEYAWNPEAAALTFSFIIFFFNIGSIFGGLLQDKFPPQRIVFVGGCLTLIGMSLGYFAPYFGPLWMHFTYGAVGAIGGAFVYTPVIFCCQQWFPDKRGFATGIVTGATAIGGIILSPITEVMLKSVGFQYTVLIQGGVFFTMALIGSLLLRPPTAEQKAQLAAAHPQTAAQDHNQKQYTTREMLRTPAYYFIMLAMALTAFSYLSVSGMLKATAMDKGLSEVLAVGSVMLSQVCSTLGRLTIPWLSDRIGRRNMIFIVCILTGVSILAFMVAKSYLLLVAIGLLSYAYGGNTAIYPAVSTDYFGTKHAGTNYGFVSMGTGITSLLAPLVGSLFTSNGMSRDFLFIVAAGAAVIAFVLATRIKANPHATQ